MSLRYSFFDAVVDEQGAYDRSYSADDFARYFSSFIGNGVYANPSTNFKVQAGGNYSLTVAPGKAFIQGRYIENDADYSINEIVPQSFTSYYEVCLRLDNSAREVSIYFRTLGGPTPIVSRTDTVFDLCLAVIAVPANSPSITDSMITDYRWNSSYCGQVASTITQLDTSALFEQYTAAAQESSQALDSQLVQNQLAFTTWFNNIQEQLDDNIVTALTASINSITNSVNTISTNYATSTRALNTWYKESTEALNFVKLPSGGLSVSTIYEVHLPLNGGNNNSGWVPHITGWQLKPFENGGSTSLTRWNYARCHGVRIKRDESQGTQLYKFDAVFYIHNDIGSAISIRPAVSVIWTLQNNRPNISDKTFSNTNVQEPVVVAADD